MIPRKTQWFLVNRYSESCLCNTRGQVKERKKTLDSTTQNEFVFLSALLLLLVFGWTLTYVDQFVQWWKKACPICSNPETPSSELRGPRWESALFSRLYMDSKSKFPTYFLFLRKFLLQITIQYKKGGISLQMMFNGGLSKDLNMIFHFH